jgi:hypothetical protein
VIPTEIEAVVRFMKLIDVFGLWGKITEIGAG